MALQLIKISEFEEVNDPKDWIVVSDETGVAFKISKENFKSWLGTVQEVVPRPLSITDPSPTVDGIYLPTDIGTYPNGLENKEGYDTKFLLDGGTWVLVEKELPQASGKIAEWEARVYGVGEQVVYEGIVYESNQETVADSIPGVSDRWTLSFLYTHRELTVGILNSTDSTFNFDIDGGSLEISGIGTVHLNADRWVFNTPQSISFPNSDNGYLVLLFNPSTLNFYIQATSAISPETTYDMICASFVFTKATGELSVNGINQYLVNGQTRTSKFANWEARYYDAGSVVYSEALGEPYISTGVALPESVPGTSDIWQPLISNINKRADFISNVTALNFDVVAKTVSVTGLANVVVGAKRYIPTYPQTVDFSGAGGYFTLLFDPGSGDISAVGTVDLVSAPKTSFQLCSVMFLETSGKLQVNGIRDYYINGQVKASLSTEWQAIPYQEGTEVTYNGKTWVANDYTLVNSIPGSSGRWDEKSPQQYMGLYVGPASSINFDLVNRKLITSSDVAAVVINNNRFLTDANQEVDFPATTGGYYAILFNKASGEFSTAVISSMTGLPRDLILVATFFHHSGTGELTVNGITDYYVNGQPVTGADKEAVVLDGELPYYNATTTESMTVNDPVVLDEMPLDDFYALYDALVTQHPDYITKEQFGQQENDGGTFLPLYYYRFNPANLIKNSPVPKKTIKVFIEAALHGGEKTAAMATYIMMEAICNEWKNDEFLETMRWNFEFVVIPVAGPYQWIQNTAGLSAGRKNINGVDPNRNFETGWSGGSDDPNSTSYRGPSPFSEIETQAIRDLATAEYESNAVAFGFHTFTNSPDDPKDITWVIARDDMNTAAQAFARKAAREYKAKETTGLGDNVPVARVNESQSGGMSYKYYSTLGYNAFLMEINENFQIVPGYVHNDNLALKYGTESVANMLRMAIKTALK